MTRCLVTPSDKTYRRGFSREGRGGGGPPAPLLFFLVKRAWLHGSVHAWSHDLLGLQASLRPANYFPFTVVML